MELALKGKVKKLGATFGIIKSIDYNEEHFFIKSDIIQSDRSKVKVGSTVAFELKVNKARGSNAHKIRLLNDKKIINNDVSKLKSSTDIETIFTSSKIHVSYKAFQEFITEGFYKLDNDDKDLNDLIKLVVSDNVITEIEKNFLKEKTLELNLSIDLTKKALEYLFSNNPFFDNILGIIFKDGLIKENELAFLLEKSKEHNFSDSFINKRFWQYYFKLHFNDLVKNKNIQKIIKLWHISKFLEFDLGMYNDWILMQMNINKNLKIENNISSALNEFERIIFPLIEERYSLSSFEAEKLYDCLSLDNDKKANNSPTLEYNKNNPFKSNSKYKIEDIYKFFSVTKEQQQGKWHNGYCEHKNAHKRKFAQTMELALLIKSAVEWYSSDDGKANMAEEGIQWSKAEFGEKVFGYQKSFFYKMVKAGNLDQRIVQAFNAKCDEIGEDANRSIAGLLEFSRGIDLDSLEHSEDATDEEIADAEDEKTLKQWNKNIVPEKHKSRIITLINNDEIFDASQEYLNFAFANDQKDFSKIMDEFEKITKNLGK